MKYDIYGIGNALVDKEFEVTEQFLQTAGIEKGMMSLIDAQQQMRLLAQLEQEFGLKKRAGGKVQPRIVWWRRVNSGAKNLLCL